MKALALGLGAFGVITDQVQLSVGNFHVDFPPGIINCLFKIEFRGGKSFMGNPEQSGAHFSKNFELPKILPPGVFGVAEHEYDISFLKFSTLGPLGLENLKCHSIGGGRDNLPC